MWTLNFAIFDGLKFAKSIIWSYIWQEQSISFKLNYYIAMKDSSVEPNGLVLFKRKNKLKKKSCEKNDT